MTLRPEFSLGHSEFNNFLFASVGEGRNGVELTVLTMLARLELDPWLEAARLAKLSKEAATEALAVKIADISRSEMALSDPRLIAIRLIDLLPSSRAVSNSLPATMGVKNQQPISYGWQNLFWYITAAVVGIYLVQYFGG